MTDRVDTFCGFLSSSTDVYVLNILPSTKLDAEKRLALQEEKQALEAKLLDVYVTIFKSTFCARYLLTYLVCRILDQR